MKDVAYIKLTTGEDVLAIVDLDERNNVLAMNVEQPFAINQVISSNGEVEYTAVEWAPFLDTDLYGTSRQFVFHQKMIIMVAKCSKEMRENYIGWLGLLGISFDEIIERIEPEDESFEQFLEELRTKSKTHGEKTDEISDEDGEPHGKRTLH